MMLLWLLSSMFLSSTYSQIMSSGSQIESASWHISRLLEYRDWITTYTEYIWKIGCSYLYLFEYYGVSSCSRADIGKFLPCDGRDRLLFRSISYVPGWYRYKGFSSCSCLVHVHLTFLFFEWPSSSNLNRIFYLASSSFDTSQAGLSIVKHKKIHIVRNFSEFFCSVFESVAIHKVFVFVSSNEQPRIW